MITYEGGLDWDCNEKEILTIEEMVTFWRKIAKLYREKVAHSFNSKLNACKYCVSSIGNHKYV